MSGRPVRDDTGRFIVTGVVGLTIASFASAWLWTRVRQGPVDERTRARLAKGSAPVVPSAAEIHVGTAR
jgi:hypothetical protein